MRLTHLSLSYFRNYIGLELELPPGLVVLQGDNAQGKSNLLEAIVLLATTRCPRAEADRELINWAALDQPMPVARAVADVERARDQVRLEVALRAINHPAGQGGSAAFPVEKRFRLDGLPQRVGQMVGQVRAVMFSSDDIELVGGAPTLRRRYLDVALSQMDRRYLHHLQRYHRVLYQRNHLLRRITQGQAQPQELSFWDGELVAHGAAITLERAGFISSLQERVQPLHQALTGGQEDLELAYRPSVPPPTPPHTDDIAERFREALRLALPRELEMGASRVGPHRDDLLFIREGVDMGVYGSRGQKRSIALSLRLAEAQLVTQRTGESPLLLLDDVLSELDQWRRHQVMAAVSDYQQVLLTTTDLSLIPAVLLDRAWVYRVEQGRVSPLNAG